MTTAQKQKQDEINNKKVSAAEYSRRMIPLRKGQEYSKKGNIPRSVEQYLTYLRVLAHYYNVEIDQISPALFPGDKNKAEMMVIGQVYWDLAKAYDRNPKLKAQSLKYLNQFVAFTIGNKWQHLNSELLRKYNNKKRTNNREAFKHAYKEIRVNSKKCYIATMCFGSEHEITNDLRSFKETISNHFLGVLFIEYYYRYSPILTVFCEKHKITNLIVISLVKPPIYLFAKIIKKTILTK